MNVTLVNISLEVSMFGIQTTGIEQVCVLQCSTNDKLLCILLLKVSPVSWSTHLSGSAYAHESWALGYLTDTVLATVAFVHTTCFHKQALLPAYTATWHYTTFFAKKYYTPGRGKIVPRNYTPGRGKIVPRNVITLLVREKLCRVM